MNWRVYQYTLYCKSRVKLENREILDNTEKDKLAFFAEVINRTTEERVGNVSIRFFAFL